MKIKGLFDQIFSMENLYAAYKDAYNGRRYNRDVLLYGDDVWTNLRELQKKIYDGTYRIDRYYIFYVYEPKKRMIMSIVFEHRIVQWAIYRVVNPLFVKGYIRDTYGCIPGRGSIGAMRRLKGWMSYLSKKEGKWFYLKLDISKYFYRINHHILIEILSKKLRDDKLLTILKRIINCEHTPFGLPAGKSPGEVDPKDMLYDVGMPIGNLLSQMFANIYLNEADQYCKRTLRIKYYVRYMDDIIILHNDKKTLFKWKNKISRFLRERLALDLNKKTCIRPISQGVEFVGYRIWHNRVALRKSTTLAIKRRLKGVREAYGKSILSFKQATIIFICYMSMIEHTDSNELKEKIIEDMVFVKKHKRKDNITGGNDEDRSNGDQ